MSTKRLDNILFMPTHVEELQRSLNCNINYMDLNYNNNPVPKMPQANFFKDGNIAISKNNRFSYVPAHTHNFIELNYMYSGKCTQYINGEKIILNEHNLIMMDKAIIQQIEYTGSNDILVNILIKNDSVINQLFDYISISSNQITQFLYNAAKINSLHNNFILFDLTNHDVAINLIESLIIKGFSSAGQRNKSMALLLSTLIIELSQSIEQEYLNFTNTTDDKLLPIIQYINQHFATTSLKKVSKKFGYNTNYLSNKIKASTGQTFKNLVDSRRLSVAQTLMLKSHYTLNEISNVIGYKNNSSLFRLFEKHLNTTPSAYKRKINIQLKA